MHREFTSLNLFRQLVYILLILPFRDIIICNSNSTYNSLPKLFRRVYEKKVLIIYNGVNIELIKCRDSSIDIDKISNLRLINVARTIDIKDQITILKACKILKKQNVNFKLTICGDGSKLNELKAYANENNLDQNVFFLGNVERSIVYKKLSESDIYINTSLSEGFCISNIEAMMSKVFILVTKIPVHLELIKNKNIFIDIKSEEDLASKIIYFSKSEKEYNRIISENFKLSKKFEILETAEEYCKVYKNVFK